MSKIQNEDLKSESDLIADGATKASLPHDTKIYVTANGVNKTLYQAILDGDIGASGVSSSAVSFDLTSDISPLEITENGLSLFSFDSQSNQALKILISVPTGYESGVQIKLKNALGYSAGASDNVLINATTTLIQIGDDVESLTNTHASGNSELTLSTANVITSLGDLNLTDASGEINSIAVAPDDLLLVELKRDNDNETTSSSEDFKIIKHSITVSFTE